jgi:hypothetical protein
MTPEQEVLYALQWNVPRSELSTAAQLEYDRLRPAWGRGEARPAAREVEAARLAWEREHPPAYEQRSSTPVTEHGSNAVPVNGDQVRDTLFCRAGRMGVAGYDALQVNDLRRRIVAELDAGGSARPLIEDATFRKRKYRLRYDIDAVDWFLGQFLLPPGNVELSGIADDPWGDLPVARVARRTSERYAFELQCDSAWRDFGQLPGTHLWFGKAGRHTEELRTAQQETLVSALRGAFSMGRRSFTFAAASASSGLPGVAELSARAAQAYYGQFAKRGRGGRLEERFEERLKTATPLFIIDKYPGVRFEEGRRSHLVDETGTPILYTVGSNFNWRACACILFPDQRWLRFLVRGSVLANAIMTAVDQAGNRVARYRIIPGRQETWFSSSNSVEIIVHPGWKVTDELALALAISTEWLRSYFDYPSGGG